MPLLISFLTIVGAFVIYIVYLSIKGSRQREENINRRKNYVESLAPDTRIIINDGVHLFFKNDEQQFFGLDEHGKKYSFEGLHSIMRSKDGISFMHKDSVSLCIGKDYGHQTTTFPLDVASINAIYSEMMPVLRNNLHKFLEKNGVHSTHEYELDGEIWGCDLDSQQFYCVYGCPQIYPFSNLIRVTVEDLRNNTLYDGSYIIHVYVKENTPGFDDNEFEIHIKTPDATYYNLLAMFKGIRNRQYKSSNCSTKKQISWDFGK